MEAKQIDDIVTISEERKTALLKTIDLYLRKTHLPPAEGLEKCLKDKVTKTDDELAFISYIFGSASGTQITIEGMKTIIESGITAKDASNLARVVSEEIDKEVWEK